MSDRLITIEELEQMVLEFNRASELHSQTNEGPKPEFPEISGVFDPSCLIDAARRYEEEYPWLPDLLANAGCGRWKYGGIVDFEKSEDVTEFESARYHSISLDHKRIGEISIGIAQGRTERHIEDILMNAVFMGRIGKKVGQVDTTVVDTIDMASPMSDRLITIEELEQMVLEYRRPNRAPPETPDKSNPDFPQISGVFDPSCLIDATHLYGDAYPWLPEVLANAGCGRWKYSGFVVYDQSEFVTESGPKPSYDVINVNDKRIGEVWISVVQVGSERRVREIEIITML